MISTATEPLEFIPLGRRAVEEHPGPDKQQRSNTNETILLQRMQNVNISAPEENNEFWCLREIRQENDGDLFRYASSSRNDGKSREEDAFDFLSCNTITSEEELYVKKHTAVWTKGQADEKSALPRICFTCETPIKLAFFCNNNFVKKRRQRNESLGLMNSRKKNQETNICIIDQNSLRAYCSNGEDFHVSLEFPVSAVWQTSFGILMEKVASSTVIQTHVISMPRIFSLASCLEEISPVLCKSATNVVGYIVESNYSIIYSSEDSDLVLLYDSKISKHFIARLRKATEQEQQCVAGPTDDSTLNVTRGGSNTNCNTPNLHNFSQHSLKLRSSFGTSHNNSNKHNLTPTQSIRNSFGASFSHTAHVNRFLNSFLGENVGSSTPVSPLFNLQSSMNQHSISMQDLRRIGQAQPSKPIVPELCLEHIWTENTYGNTRDFYEISSRAFRHTDLIAQTFICYLLPRSSKLQLIQLLNYGQENQQISTIPQSIPAKDAVNLDSLKMIAVLDVGGNLILYTGPVQICKVHVAPTVSKNIMKTATTTATTTNADGSIIVTNSNVSRLQIAHKSTPNLPNEPGRATMGKSPNTPLLRRSSLLPNARKSGENSFEAEIHMLSPVTPLHTPISTRVNNCVGLRDPVGNRLTLSYITGKMYRITLPMISETTFISRCLSVLRQILNKHVFVKVLTAWYVTRNPSGSLDYSTEKEWEVFKSLLSDLMGFRASTSCNESSEMGSDSTEDNLAMNSNNEPKEPKKRRVNDDNVEGTNDDWEFMLKVLGERSSNHKVKSNEAATTSVNVDVGAMLFPSIPIIFFSLHMLYEDFKLDETMHECLEYLAKFLHQLAVDMQLSSYALHYSFDFPDLLLNENKVWHLNESHGVLMSRQELLQSPAPSIFKQLEYILKNFSTVPYAFIANVNELSRNVIQLFSLIIHGHEKMKTWIEPLEFPDTVFSHLPPRPKRMISTKASRPEQLIQMLGNMGMTRIDIERLPVTIHLVIAECLEFARQNPPMGWPPSSYELILRTDLVNHSKFESNGYEDPLKRSSEIEDSLSLRCRPTIHTILENDNTLDDGMDNIDTKLLSLRFPDDLRVHEVRRLLSSSEPVSIDITQSPGTSDHEFIEEQEKQLFALCTRTMALSFGRGMFTLHTVIPSPTKSMPIPKLCLTGKDPLKGTTVEMQQIEFPANMSLWPTFHNGVAAGLKISPLAENISSTWIVYNKPKNPAETSTEHAGLLMALGLNGHLKILAFMNMYEYLVKCDEITSVGLLLGLAASHRGTMDHTTTKLLSVHIEALLPATALELDIPQCIQVASLMGIGLLYQGTAKRHIAEVLLQEIGRPPGPEMENSIERESYALTAGLALGLVTLGKGESPTGLQDLHLPNTLHYYIIGGNKRPLMGSQKEKYKLPSFQVREGESVNIDVTAPGATLALGLMFFNTGNRAIAEWMNPPSTRYQLDLVRPDLLLLRTIARGLILWSEIRADSEWLFAQFPEKLKFDLERGSAAASGADSSASNDEDIDHEAVTQAYCNIIAGAAFCIGLKYAGTENQDAFKSLRNAIKMFLDFPGKYVGELAGRTTIETCLMLTLISISLVFAGSGDLEILRIIRYLRSRIGPSHSQVTYGSHMAISMSLGLLFLGGGRFTIAKTPEAIAALVCAFFPKFPNHSNDNRYHLQAFRHLYVLAVEPRLFLPRDIDTKTLCLCNVSVLEIGSKELRRLPMAPCMLPELRTLRKVVVDDASYWPVVFERGHNWEQLIKILEKSGCIDIKKRKGCLSLLEDPDRLKSLMADTLTSEPSIRWEVDLSALEHFSNDSYLMALLDRLIHDSPTEKLNEEVLQRKQHLVLLLYNAVIKDKMHVLQIYLDIYEHIARFKETPNNFSMSQLKLLDIYFRYYKQRHALVDKELLRSHLERFKLHLDTIVMQDLKTLLPTFLTTCTFTTPAFMELRPRTLNSLLAVANFYNLTPNVLSVSDWKKIINSSYVDCLVAFQKQQQKFDAITTCFLMRFIKSQ